jgi:DNA-directed RNA polymerase subunit RPC12/RpoP
MNQKVKHCAMCSGACELKVLGSVSGEDASLKLTVHAMPALVCAKNHAAPVHRDFMIWLIQELRARESQFSAGKEKGMIFKKHLCGDCGKELAPKPERRQAFPFDLAYAGTPPFKLEIELPLYRCAACGKEQIRSSKDLHNHIPAAIVGINDAAGFPHSG